MTSPSKITLLLLALLHLGPARPAQAAEEALSPEFLEYLGTVEASGPKGVENMSLEEVYLMLKKALRDKNPSKKKDETPQKEIEHGNAPKK